MVEHFSNQSGMVERRWRKGRRGAISAFVAAIAMLVVVVWGGPAIFALPPGGGLQAVGPTDPQTTYPVWYSDVNGLSLKLCLDPALCIPDPVNLANPLSVQTGFGAEAFWWYGQADLNVGNGGDALLVLGLEAAYITDDPVPGGQMTFGRIRVRMDGLQPGATYTVTHPYGVERLTANNLGDIRYTEDIGCGPVPGVLACDFGLALVSRIGPFLVWDPAVAPAPPVGYIGDANTPHKVVGSALGTNYFRVEGPNAGGPGTNVAQTDLFVIQGQKFLDAVDDNVKVPQNAQGRRPVNVLANDTNATSVVAAGVPATGVSEVGTGGANVLYTPRSGFTGVDTFTYTASNGPANDVANVNVTVHAANAAPVAAADAITVAMNSTSNVVNVLSNDTDPDGDIVNVTAVAKGSNTQNADPGNFGANVLYTPKTGFAGLDSFTYTLSDGALTSDGTVNVIVDRAPVAVNDSVAVIADTANNLITVLANDSDPDANPLIVSAVTQGTRGAVSIAAGGGGVLYTPSAGFAGADNFTYTVSDGFLTAIGTVNVTIDRAAPVILSVAAYVNSPSFPLSWGVPSTWTGTPPASYDVQYATASAGPWTDLLVSTSVTSTTFTGATDGLTYYFRVRSTTATGAIGAWAGPFTTRVDLGAPSGSVTINGGAGFAASLSATLAVSATAGLSGVSEMSFSNDDITWGDWQGFSLTRAWTLAPGADGPRTVFARFRNQALNVSPVVSDSINLDTTPPSGSMAIQGLDPNTMAVTITLSITDTLSGVSHMQFSNDGLSYSPWESYATSTNWVIPGGNGSKTVYARFRDNAANTSAPVTAVFNLDIAFPTSSVSPLTPYQSAASFTVSWTGTAAFGAAGFDVQYRDGAAGAWTDWVTDSLSASSVFTGTEGHTYYFRSRLRDLSANQENYPGGDGDTHTTVDLTAPSGTVSINGGALDTVSANVTLAISATDALSGVPEASFSNDGSAWGAWEAFGTSRAWSLSSGNGQKAVWARYRDGAGNVSAAVSDTIGLETLANQSFGLSINDGALFTNQLTVTLSLPANPNTAEIMVSNDGGFQGAVWEPYVAFKSWTVTQYGSYVIPRLVYVKYKDADGNISPVYLDDVILDLTAPVGSVQLSGLSAASVGGRRAAIALTLRISASDDVSGVRSMMVSSSPAFSGAVWEPYRTTRSWTIESGDRVYVTFKDYAGNVSPTYVSSLSGGLESLPALTAGVVHPKTGGSIVSTDAGLSVSFPGGAVGVVTDVSLAPTVDAELRTVLGSLVSAGKFVNIVARAGDANVISVAAPYNMTFTYSAGDIGGIRESSLAIYWWNGSAWQKEQTSRVDTASKTVTASLDHMSSFALMGQSTITVIYLPLITNEAVAGW